jgi:hypothetical protein
MQRNTDGAIICGADAAAKQLAPVIEHPEIQTVEVDPKALGFPGLIAALDALTEDRRAMQRTIDDLRHDLVNKDQIILALKRRLAKHEPKYAPAEEQTA